MAKNLILYYSRRGRNYVNGGVENLAKGNTEIVAEFVQKAVCGDLFRIETVKPYAKDYYQCIEEAKQELRAQARPKLKDERTELSTYDNIFVLGPCWWGTYPMAMYTQLEKLDFAGQAGLPAYDPRGVWHGPERRCDEEAHEGGPLRQKPGRSRSGCGPIGGPCGRMGQELRGLNYKIFK